MPNWITNKVRASGHVISAMLGNDGQVDFSKIAPCPCILGSDWNGIYGDAETAADAVLGIEFSGNPLIASLEAENRKRVDVKKMSETSFRQFVGMLENYRACGYLHDMDFARKVWGTKWNAVRASHDISAGWCQFETAWSCPVGLLKKLSERFADEVIEVVYADEDIGSNCGAFKLLAGQITEQSIAPPRRDQTGSEKETWKAFACDVTGTQLGDDDDPA